MPFAPVTITDGEVTGVDSLSSAASSVVNWEIDEAGVNVPRPPLEAYSVTNIGTSPFIGAERWKQYLIWVSTDRYVRMMHESGPAVGTVLSTSSTSTQIEGTASRVTFVSGDDYVYIAGGGQIQRWGGVGLTELISGSPNCTHIASLGQYLIANNTGDTSIFQWSEIGEGTWTSWPDENTTQASARPDPIIGIFENANELYVFGDATTQVYAVGSDPTLPFDVVATINTGLAAPYAVTRIDETFAFLDDKRRISITDGRTVTPISDAIQSTLRGLETIEDCWMYREDRGQYSYLVVRFPTEARTFVYDIKGTRWTERKYYNAPLDDADWPVGAAVYWPAYNYWLFGSTLSTGGLFKFATTSGAENSAPLVASRVTGWHEHGTAKRKRSTRIQLVMKRGTAAQGATPGALEVRVQDDDGPWTEWEQVSVGGPSDYGQTKLVFPGGVFRRRRYGLRFSNTESFSLVSVMDDVKEVNS